MQPRSTQAIRNRLVAEVPASREFLNEEKYHDAQEWVVTLVEAIERQLDGNHKEQWRQLVSFGISEQFVCTGPGRHRDVKAPNPHVCLTLPTQKTSGEPLTSLTDAINYHFAEEKDVTRTCFCGSTTADMRLIFQSLPQVSALSRKHIEGK